MLMDWLAVQALLVLSNPIMALSGVVVRCITLSQHKSLAKRPCLSVVFHLLAVPTIVYISYKISFTLTYPDLKTESE